MRGLDLRLIDSRSLAKYMAYRELSVRALADRSGVNRSTIGHLRSGKRDTCSPGAAKAICKVLDIPTDLLFYDRQALRVARKVA